MKPVEPRVFTMEISLFKVTERSTTGKQVGKEQTVWSFNFNSGFEMEAAL